MTLPNEAFHARLQAAACRALPGAERIEGLVRLSAGATLETWSFDAVGATRRWPLILRRSPGGLRRLCALLPRVSDSVAQTP